MLDKYNDIWDKIKNKLNIKFHSMPVYKTYIKAKVREFNGVIKTNFLGGTVPSTKRKYACLYYILLLENTLLLLVLLLILL